MDTEPNTMGKFASGTVGLGLSRTIQNNLQIGPVKQFNKGLDKAKIVPSLVKGKKDIARGRAIPFSLGNVVPNEEWQTTTLEHSHQLLDNCV